MTAASNYLENKVLDHVLKNTAFSQPSSLYLALFITNGTTQQTSDRLEAGTLTDEVSTSGTAYARKTVAFSAASSGTAATSGTVTFDAATASFGTVTHVAVMDAITAGNVLFYGTVTTSKTIDSGDTFKVSSGNLTISLA
jgi:hypothetical protein